MSIVILPCPWCEKRETRIYPLLAHNEYFVECTNPECHASGPLGDSEQQAVDAWNRLPRRMD